MEEIMKRIRLIFMGLIMGIMLTLGFLWVGSIKNAFAGRDQLLTAPTLTLTSDEGAAGWKILSTGGSDEIMPPGFNSEVQGPSVLPTPIPGQTLVYFATTDSDATATVLILINTDSVAHTVALRGYSYSGVLGYSLNINVPATNILRLSSDSIAAAPPPSWATPAPIITNFTDFTYYASLSLPKGVRVEGYTLFNPGTGTVDPRLDQGAIPIRFSTDPATVFLPSVQSNP
jgi:hypothetical protein